MTLFPMNMKPLLGIALLLVGMMDGMPVLLAQDSPPLSARLKGLAGWVGRWQIQMADSATGALKPLPATMVVTVEPGGKSMSGAIVADPVKGGETPMTSYRMIWYFDPSADAIAFLSVGSDGLVEKAHATIPEQGQLIVTEVLGTTEDGKKVKYQAHHQWIDKDTIGYWETDKSIGGERVPSVSKITFKRIP